MSMVNAKIGSAIRVGICVDARAVGGLIETAGNGSPVIDDC